MADPFRDFSYREQRAQMRMGLRLPQTVRLFKPHVELGELERFFQCHGPCGMRVAVGPYFRHIVPEEFVCGGCLAPELLDLGTESSSAVEGAGKAGKSQEAVA